MSANEDETIADIVSEMRECDGYRAYYDGGLHHESREESVVDVDYLHDFANRLEAAWKREKSQSWHHREMEEVILRHEKEVAELKNQIGNAAAMREALEFCIKQMSDAICDKDFGDDIVYLVGCMKTCIERLKAAIEKSPRNCDVGTAEEQTQRYRRFCTAHKYVGSDFSNMCRGFGKNRCPFFSSRTKSQCEFAWAQMPYESNQEAIKTKVKE